MRVRLRLRLWLRKAEADVTLLGVELRLQGVLVVVDEARGVVPHWLVVVALQAGVC